MSTLQTYAAATKHYSTMKIHKIQHLRVLLAGSVFLVFYQLVEVVLHTCADCPRIDHSPTQVRKQERILLTNFLYGEKAVKKNYLRLFIESARYAKNVDFLIIGDSTLPFELPANVRHAYVSWDSLIDLLFHKVFDGEETGRVRRAQKYKVNDFKPLFAYLFPKYVEGYDWWGHVDNDMIVGNIRKWLTDDVLSQSDIITDFPGSEYGELFTHGPFTMYRNNAMNNELFKLSALPLSTILGNPDNVCFDEWGECGKMDKHVGASMSGIIHKYRESLGIRWRGSALPMALDFECYKNDTWARKVDCAPCEFSRGKLVASKTFHRAEDEEVAFCHYQFAKRRMESSLNETIVDAFVESGRFRVSYDKGFGALA